MRPLLTALVVAAVLFGGLLGAFLLLPTREGTPPPPETGGAGAPGPGPGHAGAGVVSGGGVGGSGAPSAGAGTAAGDPPGAGRGGKERERPAEEPEAKLPLRRGTAEIRIEAVDQGRNPRPGLFVSLHSGMAADESVTDAGGAAFFSGLASGTYSFRIHGDGVPEMVGAREVTVTDGESRTVVVTVGSFDLAISGRVLDREGKPVPGLTVIARKQLFQVGDGDLLTVGGQDGSAVTGSDGEYAIDRLEAADYLVRTSPTPRYPSASKVFRAGSNAADIVLEIGRDLEVYGTVSSRDGMRLENVVVTSVGQAARQGRSDAKGAYSVLVALGDEQLVYALKAKRDGYREAQVNILKSEVGEAQSWQLDISLEPIAATALVEGVLIDPEENPISGETVMLYSSVLSDRYKATTGADGRFSFGQVQVGDYRLWVYPQQRFKDYAREPVSVAEEGLLLEIELEAIETGTLRGRMVDPLGNPLPRFSLWLRSTSALNNSLTVTSDDGGRFSVEGVPAGELLFETRSFPRLTVRGLELAPEAAERGTDVSLVLDWGDQQLVGVVTDEADAPVPGARVTLHWSSKADAVQSSSIRHAVADASGRFSFSELSPSEHRITVSATNYNPEGADYLVGSGDPDPVIRLRRKPGK